MLLHNMSSPQGVVVDGESESKGKTAGGGEVAASVLAIGLTGWISHSPEEN